MAIGAAGPAIYCRKSPRRGDEHRDRGGHTCGARRLHTFAGRTSQRDQRCTVRQVPLLATATRPGNAQILCLSWQFNLSLGFAAGKRDCIGSSRVGNAHELIPGISIRAPLFRPGVHHTGSSSSGLAVFCGRRQRQASLARRGCELGARQLTRLQSGLRLRGWRGFLGSGLQAP